MSEKTDKAKRKADGVKGWKIDLKSYEVEIPKMNEATGQPAMKGGRPVMVKDEFDVQDSLAAILFNRELELNVEKTFTAKDLADKIRAAKKNVVILDQKEMDMVKAAYNVIKSPPELQLEFFARIRDAEEVELVEEKDESPE